MIRSAQTLPKIFREKHGIPLVIDTFLLYFQRKYIENINFRWLEFKRVECDAESPPPIDQQLQFGQVNSFGGRGGLGER